MSSLTVYLLHNSNLHICDLSKKSGFDARDTTFFFLSNNFLVTMVHYVAKTSDFRFQVWVLDRDKIEQSRPDISPYVFSL